MLGFSFDKSIEEYSLDIPTFSDNESEFLSNFLKTDFDLNDLQNSLREFAYDNGYYLSNEQIDRFNSLIRLLTSEHMFFEKPLNDNSVEEIAVIGLNKPIYVYVKQLGWLKTGLKINDKAFFIEVVNRLSIKSGRRITLTNPYLNANISSIGRIHATLDPISECELTIRKFTVIPFTLSDFVNSGVMSYEIAAFLWLLVLCDCSIIISGNTASGKTSFLNSITSLFSKNERILVIEETKELNLFNEHVVHLTEFGDIKLKHLIWDSLRMRPDRLLIGEIRKEEEAKALVECILAGQARSFYTTIHANSSKEVISRFKNYDVQEDVISVTDLIINLRRFREIREIESRKKEFVEKRELRDIYFPRNDLYLSSSKLKEIGEEQAFRGLYDSLDEPILFKISKLGIDDFDKFIYFIDSSIEILKQNYSYLDFIKVVNDFYGKL